MDSSFAITPERRHIRAETASFASTCGFAATALVSHLHSQRPSLEIAAASQQNHFAIQSVGAIGPRCTKGMGSHWHRALEKVLDIYSIHRHRGNVPPTRPAMRRKLEKPKGEPR